MAFPTHVRMCMEHIRSVLTSGCGHPQRQGPGKRVHPFSLEDSPGVHLSPSNHLLSPRDTCVSPDLERQLLSLAWSLCPALPAVSAGLLSHMCPLTVLVGSGAGETEEPAADQ